MFIKGMGTPLYLGFSNIFSSSRNSQACRLLMDFIFSQINMKSWNINQSFFICKWEFWADNPVNSWNLTVEAKRFAYALLRCVCVCVCNIKQFKKKAWFHMKLFELVLLLGPPDCNTNLFILTSLSFFTDSASFWTFFLVFLYAL